MTDNNRRSTRSMTLQEKNLCVYKDATTGVEFITQEQIDMRGISNEFYTKNNILVCGVDLYKKISEIHPRYRESCPEHVINRKDLFALAPEGYLWIEEDRGTSYFHWDEWYILKQKTYKRGMKYNIY